MQNLRSGPLSRHRLCRNPNISMPEKNMASSSSSSATPSQTPSSSAGVEEQVDYRGLLCQYALKNKLQEPFYQTLNEGVAEAQTKFRSTVFIDGMAYTSSDTFSTSKAAKMEASKIAYLAIMQKIRDQGLHLVLQDRVVCKSMLNEYSDKIKVEKPRYEIAQVDKYSFRCFLTFNNVVYPGGLGRNRKEAEQIAAQAAVYTILVSTRENAFLDIVSAKVKHNAALERAKELVMAHGSTPVEQTEHICSREKQDRVTDAVMRTAEAQPSSSTQEYGLLYAYRHVLEESEDPTSQMEKSL